MILLVVFFAYGYPLVFASGGVGKQHGCYGSLAISRGSCCKQIASDASLYVHTYVREDLRPEDILDVDNLA